MAQEGSASVALHEGIGLPPYSNPLKRKSAIKPEVGHKKVPGSPILFKSEDLKVITNNFDEKSFMGATQFGKVYRGKILNGFAGMEGRDVTVKIVDKSASGFMHIDDEDTLIYEEVKFLSDPTVNHHSNLVKLIGYCCEEETMGVVYDLNPLDTLYNMTLRDEFTWVKRIKVAIGFARLLKYLHGKKDPYVVFNLDPAHIILDQEYNPILFDFGLLHGGSIGELSSEKKKICMSHGYLDRCFALTGWMGTCCDVYVYGMILLQLMAKKTLDKENIYFGIVLIDKWAMNEYKAKCSLVHNSLDKETGYHASDGVLITELAMQCTKLSPDDRPTMQQVLECLERLQVAVEIE